MFEDLYRFAVVFPITAGFFPRAGDTLEREVRAVPRIWAWFHNPSTVLSLVDTVSEQDHISVMFRDPDNEHDVVITGPIIRDMACYPFLDVAHHMRRLGMKKSLANHYARVIQRGGAVVCIEAPDTHAVNTLNQLDAHDVLV